MKTEILLNAKDVKKSFQTAEGTFDVLRGADVQLSSGQTLALTGESGSGKSTLLHLIGGLDLPDSGKILINGTDVAQYTDVQRAELRRTTVGVIFQQFNLIPSLRVAENIAFQSRLAGKHDAAWCKILTDRLGLTDQLGKYPDQLSGGQQQRVAIARTIAARPRLILADEPTGNLDEDSAAEVMAILKELVAQSDAALLMVTHSERMANQLDRRLHLRRGIVA